MLCSQSPPLNVRSCGQTHSVQPSQLRAQQPVRASLAPRAKTQRRSNASASPSASRSCSFVFGSKRGVSPQPMVRGIMVHSTEDDTSVVTEVVEEVHPPFEPTVEGCICIASKIHHFPFPSAVICWADQFTICLLYTLFLVRSPRKPTFTLPLIYRTVHSFWPGPAREISFDNVQSAE